MNTMNLLLCSCGALILQFQMGIFYYSSTVLVLGLSTPSTSLKGDHMNVASLRPILSKRNNNKNDIIRHRHKLSASSDDENESNLNDIFEDFATFLQTKQNEIIQQIEEMDGSGETFCRDTWGIFAQNNDKDDGSTSTSTPSVVVGSGGITRVIQGGHVVEKGACSLTLLTKGKLSAERAATIQGRQEQQHDIKEGDEYCAAALSMVLHTRSPLVPTFRSDVRIFMVQPSGRGQTLAWFGGKKKKENIHILLVIHISDLIKSFLIIFS